jgi:hypothetical protein
MKGVPVIWAQFRKAANFGREQDYFECSEAKTNVQKPL